MDYSETFLIKSARRAAVKVTRAKWAEAQPSWLGSWCNGCMEGAHDDCAEVQVALEAMKQIIAIEAGKRVRPPQVTDFKEQRVKIIEGRINELERQCHELRRLI